MRAPPTTFEAIESLALAQPQRPAVAEGRQAWSYGHFHRTLVAFSRALDALGVRRGQRVAVSRPSFHLQLALMIAAENLGAVTTGFQADGDPDAPELFALVQWVLSEVPQACPDGTRFQLLDAAFFEAAMQLPDDGGARLCVSRGLHEPQRLARTSGSTGRSKFLVLSRGAQENLVSNAAAAGYTPDSRLLMCAPLVMNFAYVRCCMCLSVGALVASAMGADVARLQPTHVWGLPLQLDALLASLPPGHAQQGTTVMSLGGPAPPALRERAARAFGGPVRNGYGCNEAGTVSEDLDPDGIGWLRAGTDVRIVDGEGRDLPPGESGRIVVRTPCMAEGYLGEPEATAAAFRDGWFHSGDWGTLVAPRRLQVAGRHDDLVNLGGLKLPAARAEQRLRDALPLRDCAVMAVNLQQARNVVGAALVLSPGGDEAAARAAVAGALGADVHVLFLDSLPQMENGKLDRMALARRFRA